MSPRAVVLSCALFVLAACDQPGDVEWLSEPNGKHFQIVVANGVATAGAAEICGLSSAGVKKAIYESARVCGATEAQVAELSVAVDENIAALSAEMTAQLERNAGPDWRALWCQSDVVYSRQRELDQIEAAAWTIPETRCFK